jgi:hypothetical protein
MSVCDKLTKLVCDFWWGAKREKKEDSLDELEQTD